jgi:hypothetical protein
MKQDAAVAQRYIDPDITIKQGVQLVQRGLHHVLDIAANSKGTLTVSTHPASHPPAILFCYDISGRARNSTKH